MTILSYQFHNIPIWLLEDRVVYNHVLLIVLLKLYPQILFTLIHFASNEVTWIKHVVYCVPFGNHKIWNSKKSPCNLIIVHKFSKTLKELQNCTLCFNCAWSLFCSILIYVSLHFFPIFFNKLFVFLCSVVFVCSVFKFNVIFKDFL